MTIEKNKLVNARDKQAMKSQKLKEREVQLREIKTTFSKHGLEIMELVERAYQRDGKLRRLVHKVTGRVLPDFRVQIDVLDGFLKRHGGEVFLRQAEAKTVDAEAEAESKSSSNASTLSAPSPPSAPARTGIRRLVRLPNGQIVEDRRSGVDRRGGEDRRNSLTAIRRNRRYGGERRRLPNRRQSPPQYVDPKTLPKTRAMRKR
jgi:hypothetical protein